MDKLCKGCAAEPCTLAGVSSFPEECPCKDCIIKPVCIDMCEERTNYFVLFRNGKPIYASRSNG